MPDVFTLDAAYLRKKRDAIRKEIKYARYKVGETWYDAAIQNARIMDDGRVEVTFIIDHTVSGNITVTAIELRDYDDALIGKKTVSITRSDATEGVLYVCRFSLFQVVENTTGTGEYDAL